MAEEKDDEYVTSPTRSEEDPEHDVEKGGSNRMNTDLQLEKTKSIAETFSPLHEAAFIIVTCMSQLTTRKFPPKYCIKMLIYD